MNTLYRLVFQNGKSYIGITTKGVEERVSRHSRASCRKSKHYDIPLYRAWRKHGEPQVVVLAILEASQLHESEVRAIKAFGTLAPDGYNATIGGEVSPSSSPEVRAKISASLTGKKASEETKAKMSASLKAMKRAPEHIAKLRISAANAREAKRLLHANA